MAAGLCCKLVPHQEKRNARPEAQDFDLRSSGAATGNGRSLGRVQSLDLGLEVSGLGVSTKLCVFCW